MSNAQTPGTSAEEEAMRNARRFRKMRMKRFMPIQHTYSLVWEELINNSDCARNCTYVSTSVSVTH